MISVVSACKKTWSPSFLSALPMFVPSLSWQNDNILMYKWLKQTVSTYRARQAEVRYQRVGVARSKKLSVLLPKLRLELKRATTTATATAAAAACNGGGRAAAAAAAALGVHG
jgi:hypothetical protein